MNQQQLQYFKALSNDRTQNADILDKESMKGVKNSVVEKNGTAEKSPKSQQPEICPN